MSSETKGPIKENVCAYDANDANDPKSRVRTWILQVRTGDQEAFAMLLEQYRPLIDASVMRFCNKERSELHEDDLRQEATLVFYNSIMTYDMEQGEVEFGLYAKVCIFNALVSRVRMQQKHMAEQSSEFLSTSFFLNEEDPAASILEQERTKALYSVIRANLSDLEYRIWQYYVSGRTAKEIGKIVGKDEKSVSNAVYRIRKKLRAVLQ